MKKFTALLVLTISLTAFSGSTFFHDKSILKKKNDKAQVVGAASIVDYFTGSDPDKNCKDQLYKIVNDLRNNDKSIIKASCYNASAVGYSGASTVLSVYFH